MTTTTRDDAPYQPVLRLRDSAWRYAVVVLISVVSLSEVNTTWWFPVEIALALALLAALRFRRRWPLPLAIAMVAANAVSYAALGPLALATVSLSTRRRWQEIAAFAATAAGSYVVTWKINIWGIAGDSTNPPTFIEGLFWFMASLAAMTAWGLYVGSRRELLWTLRERADRLEREQATLTQKARDAERAQIAREMHDVLAHRISHISMQAGAIAFRTDLGAEDLRASAQPLHTSANAALDDLRVVLGVLRDPNSGGPVDAPQPRAVDIDKLIDTARSHGMRIDYDTSIEPGLDETIGRTLYRITQECITNARKHATGTTLSIHITGSATNGVTFVASNPVPLGTTGSNLPRSGYGLIGLAERAELAGGTLNSIANQQAFTVTAHLPWHPEPAPRPRERAQ